MSVSKVYAILSDFFLSCLQIYTYMIVIVFCLSDVYSVNTNYWTDVIWLYYRTSDYYFAAAIWWCQSKITQFNKLIRWHDFVNIWRDKCNLFLSTDFYYIVATYAMKILTLLLKFERHFFLFWWVMAARDRKTEGCHSGFSTRLTLCCTYSFSSMLVAVI